MYLETRVFTALFSKFYFSFFHVLRRVKTSDMSIGAILPLVVKVSITERNRKVPGKFHIVIIFLFMCLKKCVWVKKDFTRDFFFLCVFNDGRPEGWGRNLFFLVLLFLSSKIFFSRLWNRMKKAFLHWVSHTQTHTRAPNFTR